MKRNGLQVKGDNSHVYRELRVQKTACAENRMCREPRVQKTAYAENRVCTEPRVQRTACAEGKWVQSQGNGSGAPRRLQVPCHLTQTHFRQE